MRPTSYFAFIDLQSDKNLSSANQDCKNRTLRKSVLSNSKSSFICGFSKSPVYFFNFLLLLAIVKSESGAKAPYAISEQKERRLEFEPPPKHLSSLSRVDIANDSNPSINY